MTDPTDIGDPEREDEIVQAVADGLSATKAAQQFGVGVNKVRELIKRATDALADGETLRREWMLEDRRLRSIGLLFYDKARREGNPADAMIFIKANERRSVMNGANAPTSYQIHLMNEVAPIHNKSSTVQVRAALDNVMGITPRERELLDKQQHPLIGEAPLTDAEVSELKQLTVEREAKSPSHAP